MYVSGLVNFKHYGTVSYPIEPLSYQCSIAYRPWQCTGILQLWHGSHHREMRWAARPVLLCRQWHVRCHCRSLLELWCCDAYCWLRLALSTKSSNGGIFDTTQIPYFRDKVISDDYSLAGEGNISSSVLIISSYLFVHIGRLVIQHDRLHANIYHSTSIPLHHALLRT